MSYQSEQQKVSPFRAERLEAIRGWKDAKGSIPERKSGEEALSSAGEMTDVRRSKRPAPKQPKEKIVMNKNARTYSTDQRHESARERKSKFLPSFRPVKRSWIVIPLFVAAITLLSLPAFSFQSRDTLPGSTRTVTVSAATIAKLAPGKTYEIDLTRKGTIYKFNVAGTDFKRVTIRTAAGVKTFAELLKVSNTSLSGTLVVGTPADMRNHIPKTAVAVRQFDCGAISCKCEGFGDCIDLILSARCQGGTFWCNPETGRCFCMAKPW
jgi:hypothetical protein